MHTNIKVQYSYPSEPFFGIPCTTTQPPSLRPNGSLSMTGFSWNCSVFL